MPRIVCDDKDCTRNSFGECNVGGNVYVHFSKDSEGLGCTSRKPKAAPMAATAPD